MCENVQVSISEHSESRKRKELDERKVCVISILTNFSISARRGVATIFFGGEHFFKNFQKYSKLSTNFQRISKKI